MRGDWCCRVCHLHNVYMRGDTMKQKTRQRIAQHRARRAKARAKHQEEYCRYIHALRIRLNRPNLSWPRNSINENQTQNPR